MQSNYLYLQWLHQHQTLHIWRKVRSHRSSRLPSSYKVSLKHLGRVNCRITPGSTTTVVLCLEEVVVLQSLPTRIDVNKSKGNGFVRSEKDLEKVSDFFCIVLVLFKRDTCFVEKKWICFLHVKLCIRSKKNKWIKNFLFHEKFWYSPPRSTFSIRFLKTILEIQFLNRHKNWLQK